MRATRASAIMSSMIGANAGDAGLTELEDIELILAGKRGLRRLKNSTAARQRDTLTTMRSATRRRCQTDSERR